MKRKSKHQYKKSIQQSHLKSLNTKNHPYGSYLGTYWHFGVFVNYELFQIILQLALVLPCVVFGCNGVVDAGIQIKIIHTMMCTR
jgi:hypothetical protein